MPTVGEVYKIGDKLRALDHQGNMVEAAIPEGPCGELIIAAKNYANSIGMIVKCRLYEQDGMITEVASIGFVTVEMAEADAAGLRSWSMRNSEEDGNDAVR